MRNVPTSGVEDALQRADRLMRERDRLGPFATDDKWRACHAALADEVPALARLLREGEARATGAVQDLAHLARLVHRSHHNEQEGTYETCTRPICADMRRAIARGKGA
jgi:hypothetical protein